MNTFTLLGLTFYTNGNILIHQEMYRIIETED